MSDEDMETADETFPFVSTGIEKEQTSALTISKKLKRFDDSNVPTAESVCWSLENNSPKNKYNAVVHSISDTIENIDDDDAKRMERELYELVIKYKFR